MDLVVETADRIYYQSDHLELSPSKWHRSSVTSRYFMLHSHGRHDGYDLLPRITGLLAAPGLPLADPRERGHAPGVSGRRSRWRACGKCGHSEAQKGPQHGKGQTSAAEAGAPCPILRVVHPPRARRRRHGDLPGQGAGHVPCRVSGPVSCRNVAMGGAVGTGDSHTTYSPAHGATRCRRLSRSLMN